MKTHHKATTRPTANKALQSSLDAVNAALLASLTRERPLSQSIELGESAAGKQYVKSVNVAQQAGEDWPDFCDRALDMLAKLRGGIDRAERLAAESARLAADWPDFCDRALDMLAKLRGGIDRAERLAAESARLAAECRADLEREVTAIPGPTSTTCGLAPRIGNPGAQELPAEGQGGNGNAVHD